MVGAGLVAHCDGLLAMPWLTPPSSRVHIALASVLTERHEALQAVDHSLGSCSISNYLQATDWVECIVEKSVESGFAGTAADVYCVNAYVAVAEEGGAQYEALDYRGLEVLSLPHELPWPQSLPWEVLWSSQFAAAEAEEAGPR
jgi:hypothetical protein